MKPQNQTSPSTLEEKSNSPYDITTCRAGTSGCKNALIDARKIADNIKQILDEVGCNPALPAKKIPYHLKFKAAVAGCPNSCSQPQIKDFGISGQAKAAATDNPCTECMECVRICKEDGAVKVIDAMPVLDYELCVLCGDCAKVCPTESIIIEKKGLKVIANGKLGRHPKLAETLAELADENEAYNLLENIVTFSLQPEPL